jgi:iron complex outermembrane receptor protein
LTMSETGIGTNIYIRGIGSGINPGFEQSVGMYFDGVSYGRAQLSRAPFLDLARVEVLRGPQNILFGKNSIAGALSLISARPGQEFEGMVSGTYEAVTNEQVLDLVLSGGLTDTIGARLAIRKRLTDGYMENLTLNRDEPERDEQTIRAIFEWDATANLTAALKLEVGQFDVNGRQIEIINDNPSTSTSTFFAGKTYAEILDRTIIGVQPVPGGPTFAIADVDADSSVLNNYQDYKRSSNGDFSYNDTQNLTLNVDYGWGEHTFTFITGILGYKTNELCDCDFTGAEVFSVAAQEEYSQFSQEIRWVSPLGENFDFIAGAFYQQSSLDFFDSIQVESDILPGLLNAKDLQSGGGAGERGDGAGDAGDEIRNLGTPRDFTTDTMLLSGFVQATWNVSDFSRATLGLRYSYEEKEGARKLELSDITTGEIRDIGEVDSVVARNFSAERHDLSGERSGGNLAPSLNIQHDWSDDVMLYATASIGYKSGGFDARSNASPDLNEIRPVENTGNDLLIIKGSFEYDDEQATSFEAGAKTTLLDGAAELNFAAFYTQYDDLQVSIFDGTLGFNVGNAGAATTMGLEMDGRIALSENIMMTGALAFLDFEFTDFKNGQCYQGQTENKDPDTGLCDYNGMTNQYVSDYSGNLTFVYTTMVSKDIEFRGGADFVFTGAYNSSQNLDPSQEQDAYIKANLRISLADVAAGWDVALLLKNATDETTISYSNDTPLANSTFGSIGHYGFIDAPLTAAMQATYRWY